MFVIFAVSAHMLRSDPGARRFAVRAREHFDGTRKQKPEQGDSVYDPINIRDNGYALPGSEMFDAKLGVSQAAGSERRKSAVVS
jgi:hypothetical protein